MSESIKFGPEWLRNRLSTSPTKQEEINCRPILANFRYSREDFLGLLDERNSRKFPDPIVDGYTKLHVHQWQTPAVLLPEEEEKPVNSGHTRTFVNSNIKHGFGNNVNNNWRKNVKEPELESWRNQDKRETQYNPSTSRNGDKSKQNWREKSNYDDQASNYPYSPAKDYDFKQPERRDITPNKNEFKSQNTAKRAETVEEKQNRYVMNIVSDATTKNLFENGSKSDETKKTENSNIQSKSSSSNSCELNFKKLENDIMVNLQELSIDDDDTIEKANENRQPNNSTVAWYYIDPFGVVQGPFRGDEMTNWYKHGFFYEALLLRRSIDLNYTTLNHLVQNFGAAQPFTLPSTGFPIPKIDPNELLAAFKQPPPKMIPMMNQQNQFDATMYRGQNLVQQYQEPVQYQNNGNIQQFQQNIPQNFQFLQNRPPPTQPNMSQIDPRLMNMNNVNPYVQRIQHQQITQQQIPPQMMNQMPPQMKPAYQAPIVNQYQQQSSMPSMIHQMPSILPQNPIQKLLFELQKQKELEQQQQRAMLIQQAQNAAVQSINEQIMQQQQAQQIKMEASRQNKIQNTYYSNNSLQHKYEQNLAAVSNNNQQNGNFNNAPKNQVIEEPQIVQEQGNIDADDEGEFRVVGNLKRKKNQKEKSEKVKEFVPQQSRSATKLPESKITVIKNDLKSYMTDVKPVKSNNDISQIIANQLNKAEERSRSPAMPAPWIDKVPVNSTEIENLKRIQLEEEEMRQIEMQIKRDQELEKAKKEQEMKQKVTQLSWNIVVTEKPEENAKESSIWEVPQKSTKPINKSTNQASGSVKNKPVNGSSSSNNNGTKEVKNDFENWCMDMLSKMNTAIDIPVFVSFLIDQESPFEIEDYIKMYLGDTIESHLFTRKFLERRSQYRKASKKVEVEDDLCMPPKAKNPLNSHHEEPFRTQNKKKNDKKARKGMKVDANILGFKATAASNRIVGELHDDEY